MPRSIEIRVPPEKADLILQRVEGMEGVVGLARQRGAAILPPGDIVTVETTNDGSRSVLEILTDLEVAEDGSVATSEPLSVISTDHEAWLGAESNEATWDEMGVLLRQDTNLRPNFVLLMIIAGAVAAMGLWSDTLHVVVGSMVIAPAFEPLVRIPFGMISGARRVTMAAVKSAVAGYLLLALGAAIAVLILRVVDPGASTVLESRHWVRYWSTVTPVGIVSAVFAGAAGATVVSGLRSVLTTGVMIALALVPSMAIVGMALLFGDVALAGRGLLRWAVDAGVVVLVSAAVLGLKRILLHRGRSFG